MLRGTYKKYHARKLRNAIKRYLKKEPNEETFTKDVKIVIRVVTMGIQRVERFQEKQLRLLGLNNEGRLRRAFAITNLSAQFEKEKIEKSARVCGIV